MFQIHFRRMLNLKMSYRRLKNSTTPFGIKLDETLILIKSNLFLSFKPNLNPEVLKTNACTLVKNSTITGSHLQLSKKLLKKLASYYIESMQNKRMNTQFLFINTSISILHLNDIFNSLKCMTRYHRLVKASNLVQDISNDNNQ